MKLLIVGNRDGTNVGGCLERAAAQLGLDARLVETWPAMHAPAPLRHLNWRLRGRRPTWLESYGAAVADLAANWGPDLLLSIGSAPLSAAALARIGAAGTPRACLLTDDPWNPAHHAPWLLRALPHYDLVLSTRTAALDDLRRLGCPHVEYLPFAYDPALHFPDLTPDPRWPPAEVVFVGGGDADRAPIIAALADAGLGVGLYGSYWERFAPTRALARGQIDPPTTRRVTGGAALALCLVRRANRDGHVMRSFEIAAIGACMLAEDTTEHRAIFGPDGAAVRYFADTAELVVHARWLLERPAERVRLASAAHTIVTTSGHTYVDRLRQILASLLLITQVSQ